MPIAKKNIPQDFLDQMKNNLTKTEETEINEPRISKTLSSDNSIIDTASVSNDIKKEKYADVMNIRLSKGRRNEIKAFCSSCGVSVTQYIESSFEFLYKEVTEGNIVISKGGISKLEK